MSAVRTDPADRPRRGSVPGIDDSSRGADGMSDFRGETLSAPRREASTRVRTATWDGELWVDCNERICPRGE
ncbi:hypothetical protein [Halalkalicoccus jeotgali]|uniref:hypothetical protein n=1 Tax=Halalkalicoccus jeotgali TaxID=413810 RepID=UPI0011D273FE|nr:hypothetical protein [Halalkalicoccus jeotgali]